jgi:hypothetical protein
MKSLMKTISAAFFLCTFFFLCACTDQEEIELANTSAKYVELNYSNYNSLKTDPITVISAKVDGDYLVLTLQYGGGCEEHQVDLALIQPDCGTPPLPPPTFEIRHNANGDSCKALITKEYSFNISGIRKEGKRQTNFILSAKNTSGTLESTQYTYKY